MERPLTSDNAVIWRKYAEALEAELKQYRPQDTGITIYGIPMCTDESVPDGEVQLRYRGTTVFTIIGLHDFMGHISDLSYANSVVDKVYKGLNRVRSVLMREPDQICVPPKTEYEPCEPGVFPRIKGEDYDQYMARYHLYLDCTARGDR